MVGRHADRDLVLRFVAFPPLSPPLQGQRCLGLCLSFRRVVQLALGSQIAVITPVELILGAFMLTFALFELVPTWRGLRFDRKYFVLGGVLSGYFGGFSGHQGALRSAFLTKVGISPQAFLWVPMPSLAFWSIWPGSWFMARSFSWPEQAVALIVINGQCSPSVALPPLPASSSVNDTCTNSPCEPYKPSPAYYCLESR